AHMVTRPQPLPRPGCFIHHSYDRTLANTACIRRACARSTDRAGSHGHPSTFADTVVGGWRKSGRRLRLLKSGDDTLGECISSGGAGAGGYDVQKLQLIPKLANKAANCDPIVSAPTMATRLMVA